MALRLWDNRISDVVPLANLQNLEELQLQNNLIVDMKPITSLKRWQTRCERDPVVYIWIWLLLRRLVKRNPI